MNKQTKKVPRKVIKTILSPSREKTKTLKNTGLEGQLQKQTKIRLALLGVGGEELLQDSIVGGPAAPGTQPPVLLRFSHLCSALQGGTKDSFRSAIS